MKRLVVVGGGTAGWLSAVFLASRLNGTATEDQAVQVTLVEASDMPPVGVGEATVPSIRNTLLSIGIDEYTFMRECDATFKHGIRFDNWTYSAQERPGEYFYHPFQRPIRANFESLAGYWLAGMDPHSRPFFDAVSVQPRISDALLAPKRFEDPPYAGPLPYAYHLDAGKLAVFLKTLALQRGVQHRLGTVERINVADDGRISSLRLDCGDELFGDVFIDCSGFRARLIGEHYRETFNSQSHILLCDTAIACQVPHRAPNDPVRPFTLATAQSAGWIWDIGLKNRRGVGHVFSSRHMSSDEAEAVLRGYIGPHSAELACRTLRMTVGYRARQWVQNCVAVGLAAGFLEPLESTGIHLIELALYMLEQMLPRYFNGGSPQRLFNELMRDQFDISIDFIKLHYCLSRRTDSDFWQENTAAGSLTDALWEKLADWKTGYPSVYDTRVVHSVFDHMGYQYIYFGMGRRPEIERVLGHHDRALAANIFQTTYEAFDKAQRALPNHRALIERIHQ